MNQPRLTTPPLDDQQLIKLVAELNSAEAALQSYVGGRGDVIIDPLSGVPVLLREAQQALLKSERFALATIDALSAHLAILDDSGAIIAVNRVWRTFAEDNASTRSGFDVNEGANYLTVCDSVQGADLAQAQAMAAGIRSVLAGEQAEFSLDYACHSPTEQRWFVARVTGFVGDGDRRIVVAHENITERKQADERIRFQAQLLDTVGQAVIATDLAGSIIYWNHFAEMLYGWPASEALGRNIIQITPSGATQEQGAEIMARLQAGESWSGEFIVQRRDGTRFPTLVSDSPIFAANGTVIGVLGISTDISELKQREYELEAIAKASLVLRTAESRADMPTVILDMLMELFKGEGASLVTHDSAAGEWLVELGCGNLANTTGIRHPDTTGLSGQVIASGELYLSNNINADPGFVSLGSATESLSAAGAPLIAQSQTIGVLWIGRRSPITPAEARLLIAIADIAANAMQRATLHAQTERRLQQLQSLRAIDEAIKSSLDLRLTLNILLVHVVEQLHIDAACIWLLNQKTLFLEVISSRGFRARLPQRMQLRLGEGYAGRAALERHPVYIPNLLEQTDNPRMVQTLGHEGFVSYYALPLMAKGQVQGVMEIFSRTPLNFNDDWLEFLDSLSNQTAIAIDNAQLFASLQHTTTELLSAYNATIEGWSRALDLRDKETEGHSQRVTQLTLDLAQTMGDFNETDLKFIRWGALLHDIGKMGVRDSILLKPDKLNDEEWEIMRRHPTYAYELLSPITYLRPALDIPYCHHEMWDGTGYPRQLKGDLIPLAARVFAVVDVWDALRSDRPYRLAWPEDKVREHIRSLSGTHFDPKVVEVFLDLV